MRDIGKARKKPQRMGAAGADESLEHIESKIRRILGTKVTVNASADGRGQITIDYYSPDDLDRLLDLFAIIEKYH